MTTPRPDSRLDTHLGPYRIERVIGRGGMGVVYLAEQTELGRKVALKLLPDDIAHDKDFRARFDRESRLAASIDHPNIIPLYEAGEIDGTAFLAMRYVEGTDLATRLRDGPLEPETAVEILDQVASALDAAHARGLVHRDVKPGNVLLDATAREGHDHAYLTDFGLTKQAGSESGLTRAGAFMGTPAYMAPEQIEGRDVDGHADQYSLAAMAFEALTGAVPFKRDQDIAVAMAHLKDAVPSAVALRPELPAAVDTVLAQGMAKEPRDRYASCAALVADLRTALGGGAVVARPIRSSRRRTPILVAAALGLGLVAMAGLALAAGFGGPGSASPPPSGLGAGGSLSSVAASPTPDPSAFPTADETELLDRLPPDIAVSCERGSYSGLPEVTLRAPLNGTVAGTRPPLASLTCEVPGSPVRMEARLTLSASGSLDTENADAWVSNRLYLHRLQAGDCATSPRAHGRWTSGGEDAGAIACTTADGEAIIYWSKTDGDFYGVIRRADGDSKALYDWWKANNIFISP